MTNLLWPGDDRANDVFSDSAFLAAMVTVEHAWLEALVDAGVAPSEAVDSLADLVSDDDLPALSDGSESGGNPVIGLLSLLRERVASRNEQTATWLHRGLTSQDVLDTALILCARDSLETVERDLLRQVRSLMGLADTHRRTPMVGRTLTQHAVSVTFGLKVAGWLSGVVDAVQGVRAARSDLPVQVGGAAGSLAAVAELAAHSGSTSTPGALAEDIAARLHLRRSVPWHTSRRRVTTLGDTLVSCTDAWGHIATDIATLARPELGELHEARGGGSSTMPNKQNPVLSILVRRAAITTPALASVLHTASALAVDERPDGAWHAEWDTLRTLARRTVVAGSQTADLLEGLVVDAPAMARSLASAGDGVAAEQGSIAALFDSEPSPTYLGDTNRLIDEAISFARTVSEEQA